MTGLCWDFLTWPDWRTPAKCLHASLLCSGPQQPWLLALGSLPSSRPLHTPGPLPAGWTQGSCTFYMEAGSRVQKTEATGLVKGCALYQPCHFLYSPGQSGLPWWISGKESTCQCRRHRFGPLVGKIPWRRKWHPTPAFLLGKFHGGLQ